MVSSSSENDTRIRTTVTTLSERDLKGKLFKIGLKKKGSMRSGSSHRNKAIEEGDGQDRKLYSSLTTHAEEDPRGDSRKYKSTRYPKLVSQMSAVCATALFKGMECFMGFVWHVGMNSIKTASQDGSKQEIHAPIAVN